MKRLGEHQTALRPGVADEPGLAPVLAAWRQVDLAKWAAWRWLQMGPRALAVEHWVAHEDVTRDVASVLLDCISCVLFTYTFALRRKKRGRRLKTDPPPPLLIHVFIAVDGYNELARRVLTALNDPFILGWHMKAQAVSHDSPAYKKLENMEHLLQLLCQAERFRNSAGDFYLWCWPAHIMV